MLLNFIIYFITCFVISMSFWGIVFGLCKLFLQDFSLYGWKDYLSGGIELGVFSIIAALFLMAVGG